MVKHIKLKPFPRTFKLIGKLFHTFKRPVGLDILKSLNAHDRVWAVDPCCFEAHSVCSVCVAPEAENEKKGEEVACQLGFPQDRP